MGIGDSTRIGTEIAGYRLESLLGRGGMSVVYLAEHVRLGRRVALKLLAPMLSNDETYRDRFQRESRRAAELDHPNVVPIFDAGEADGQLFIAMRYIEGCDLKTLIGREGALGIGRTLFILEQAADGLDAAHDRDLIHRDVKPANILIAEPSEHVYLTDFGVVKHTASKGLTRTGFFIGTVDYARPEQIEGSRGRAPDVYALGCVLYESLVGKAPFDREAEITAMHAHLIDAPPLLTASRPDLPKGLNRVLASALAKSKDDRYDTCGQLIEAARVAALQRSTTSYAGREAAGVAEAAPEIAADAEVPTPPPEPGLPAMPAAAVAMSTPEANSSDAGGVVQVETPADPPAAQPPAEPPAQPPASPDGGRGRRGPNRTWLVAGAAIAVAALLAAAGVWAVTRDSNSGAGPPTTASTTAPPSVKIGLAGVVAKDVWDNCAVSSTPQPGAVESAICLAPTNGTAFFPDRVDLSIYADDAARKQAFDALRASDPHSAALVAGKGNCNNLTWSGFGVWRHTNGDFGGQRYCYVDAK